MNKNFKIIQISGLSGALFLGLIILGLFCGFVLFPIWVLMIGWNSVVNEILRGPAINYVQAALLWSVISLGLYLMLKNSISIKFEKDIEDNPEIMEKINKIKQSEEVEIKEEIKK